MGNDELYTDSLEMLKKNVDRVIDITTSTTSNGTEVTRYFLGQRANVNNSPTTTQDSFIKLPEIHQWCPKHPIINGDVIGLLDASLPMENGVPKILIWMIDYI